MEATPDTNHNTASGDEYWADFQSHIEQYAGELETAHQCSSLKTLVNEISERWREQDPLNAGLQADVEQLWWQFCEAGMNASRSSPLEQQRLIQVLNDINDADAGAPVHSSKPGKRKRAQDENRFCWTGLPFLEATALKALQHSFDEYQRLMGVNDEISASRHLERWANLNALVARVSAASVCDLRISSIWALCNVLEEDVLTTSLMLEVLVMWLDAYSLWLESLGASDLQRRETKSPSTITVAPGRLAKAAAVTDAGVSVLRWRLWRERLLSLADGNTEEAAPLATLARRALEHLPKM